jgi:crotonobetainyl-CoA:carnitine CoA-transferase CaiB-like acyl-CoA transferase
LDGALKTLRVLDFSRVLAGPFATMLLGDLGADVLKVERPGQGDDTRSWGPPWDDRDVATYYLSANRNKRSVALDLGSEEGRDRARELALGADVLVENFRPGLLDSMGLGYEALAAANPRLVYCSITGFGRGGGAELPGYDLLVQAVGGLMSITGEADAEPQKVGVALVDVLAGLFASVGILAALRRREESGCGQRVEVDLLTALLAALVNQAAGYTAAGVVPERMGNRHPSIAPYEVIPCGEGELVLAVGTDRQFAALCEVLGEARLARDERFALNASRVANRVELRSLIQGHLASHPATEWARRLTAARVPAGVVNDLAGAFALAESLGLEPIVRISRDDGGELALARNPIGLSESPAGYRIPPPPMPAADDARGVGWRESS